MKKNGFAVIPFNSAIIKDRYLVSNMLGNWDFLAKDEFKVLQSSNLTKKTPFFNRLRDKGLVIDENNLKTVVDDYRSLNLNLFNDTSLHIAVVTTRCNLKCTYCQTKALKQEDMSYEVAGRVLKYIFDVQLSLIHI